MSQVRFWDSFACTKYAFTKYEGILQKVTGNRGDRTWGWEAVQDIQLHATV